MPDTPPNALPAAASLFEIVAGRERRIILERPEPHNSRQTQAAASLAPAAVHAESGD
ncbi:MAG: hypothetical protein ABSG56_12385 [Bryobacteraceae bacterium]